MNCGLSQSEIAAIRAVLQNHPQVNRAILYSSRAKGNYKPSSDIDLTLQASSLIMLSLRLLQMNWMKKWS